MTAGLGSLKKLCSKVMPMVEEMHEGIKVTESLTEYQAVTVTDSRFSHIYAHDNQAIRDGLMMIHTYIRWLSFGMPVLKPTPDLWASLVLTDPSNVNPSEVKQPFPTFFVALPPKTFYSKNGDGMDEELTFVMINTISTIHNEVRTDVLLEDALKLPHYYLTNIMMCGPTVFLIDSLPTLGKSDLSMGQWLNTNQEKTMWIDIDQDDRDLHIRLTFRRLLVNLCLYIVERGKGTREKSYTTKSSKRRKNGKPKKMKAATWIIGREVKMGKDIIEAAKDWIDAKKGNKVRWKIKRRSVTRGHWRNQVCGPKRAERKRIWIEPFWRGPKEGSKVQHIYTNKVKEVEDEALDTGGGS